MLYWVFGVALIVILAISPGATIELAPVISIGVDALVVLVVVGAAV